MTAYANRGIALLSQSKWDKARSDLHKARNMGKDLPSLFASGQGSVANFQEKHNVKLPKDIEEMISMEESPRETFAGESVLEIFREIRESVSDAAYDDMPPDGARNYKHYLYGWPRE
jgi:hypothetical protein